MHLYIHIGLQEENIQKNNAILTEIRQMWNYVRRNNEHDKQKVSEITGSRSEVTDVMNMMPVKNLDELDLLEKKLKSPEFKNVMVIYFFINMYYTLYKYCRYIYIYIIKIYIYNLI